MDANEEQQIQLMAYLDGEMNPQERTQYERVLMQSPELQRRLAQFQKLQSIVRRVRIPEPKPELWDEFPRRNTEKWLHISGWVLFVVGALIVAIASQYFLWMTNDIPCCLKIGFSLLGAGLVLLLVSVHLRRRKEGKTDRYKEIVR